MDNAIATHFCHKMTAAFSMFCCDVSLQRDSLVGRCVAPLEKTFKDQVIRLFPTCTYSRDPTINASKEEEDEEEEGEEEDDEGSIGDESATSDSFNSDSETIDENSSATVFEEHSYFTAKPSS